MDNTTTLEPPAIPPLCPASCSLSRSYSVIMADPPWRCDDKRAGDPSYGAMTYPTMSVEEICALQVKKIAAKDCALFLWATMPLLEEAMQVIKAWGFNYRTCAFVWLKQNTRNSTPKLLWADITDAIDASSMMGMWTMGNVELCLFAKRGAPKRLVKNVKQVVIAPRGRHSEKPAEVRRRIEQLLGDVPRLEMFARSRVSGWDAWGNELKNDVELVTGNDKL